MPKKEILQMRDKTDKYTTKKDKIFDLPMRLVVCGSSGMGKTNLAIGNFLLRDSFYRKDFKGENVFLFTGSSSEQKLQTVIEQLDIPKSNIFPDYDERALEAIYDMLVDDYNEAIEDHKRPENSLIILDDLGFKNLFNKARKNNQVDRLFTNGRKYNISVILILQRWSMCSTNVRSNCSGAIVGQITNKELELLERDMNYLDSKKKFFKMFREQTNGDKHSFMVFNLSKPDIYQDKNFETINVDNI